MRLFMIKIKRCPYECASAHFLSCLVADLLTPAEQ